MNAENAPRLPNTSNIMVDYAEGEGLVISLDLKGVAVSTGSACSSGSLEPSHVLTAIGKTPDEAHGSLRFSLSIHDDGRGHRLRRRSAAGNRGATARIVAVLQERSG